MTLQQVELLRILRNYGPITVAAVVGELGWRYYEHARAGIRNNRSCETKAVASRLRTLERLGWARSRPINTIHGIGYYNRDRYLWGIAYAGYAALREKECRDER